MSKISHQDTSDSRVTLFEHPSGLKAVVAICSTVLGPALSPLGVQNIGIQEATEAAIRKGNALAEKCALHDAGHGGGCVIVIGDVAQDRAVFHELAAHICDHYRGLLIIGQDVGVSESDIAAIAGQVNDKASVAYHPHGPNHAEVTARGVRLGIETCLRYVFNGASPSQVSVLVQGCGKVGLPLAHEVRENITDWILYSDRVPGAVDGIYVTPEEVYDQQIDVLSPCISVIAAIDEEVVKRLKARIIAGSSNVQFANEAALQAAHDKEILHAPDMIINGGGVIAITQPTSEKVEEKLRKIPEVLTKIFERSRQENRPPMLIAQQVAREIIAIAAKKTKNKI